MKKSKFIFTSMIIIFFMLFSLFTYIPALANNNEADNGIISGTLWYDANGNGKIEPSDLNKGTIPISTVSLCNVNGDVLETTNTNSNGQYSFTGLLKGEKYKIKVLLPQGYDFTPMGSGNGKGVQDRLTKIDSKIGITNNLQPDRFNVNIGLKIAGDSIEEKRMDLLDITRTIDVNRVEKGNAFDVTYTITPKDISVDKDNTQKDVVLVVDTSGSMRWVVNGEREPNKEKNSRLGIMKRVATNFVNNFVGEENVNISLIEFNSKASKVVSLTNMKTGKINGNGGLIKEISDLVPEGSTNIGDALRVAYNELNTDNGHDKYLIFLTDGVAEAYSKNSNGYIMGTGVVSDSNIYTTLWYNTTNGSKYVDPYNDYRIGALEYANKVAIEKIKNSGIKTTMIGFSSGAGSNNAEIAENAGADYKLALDEQTLTFLYSNIEQEIKSTINGTVYFQEKYNGNLEVQDKDNLPFDFDVDNNKVNGNIPVEYTFDEDENVFVPEPITFTISYYAKERGEGILGDRGDSSYAEISVLNDEEVVYLDSQVINIYEKSEIAKHGLFISGNKSIDYIIEPEGGKSINIVDGIKQHLGFKISIKNNNTIVSWRIETALGNEDLNMYLYKLNDLNELEFINEREININESIGSINAIFKSEEQLFQFEEGKDYIIVSSFTPSTTNNKSTIKSTVTIDDTEADRDLQINIMPLPELK